MTDFYMHTPGKRCPHCDEFGGCRYVEIPASRRTYKRNHEEFMDEFGITHEYACDNCSAEWIIVNPEELE
jgi:hypothetical protein